MATQSRLICASAAVVDGGKGFRFTVTEQGEERPAFVIRYHGRLYAYLNRCAHVSVELDWMEGEFFDYSGLYLVCSTHGAAYVPETGHCVAGPCKGRRLIAVSIEESNEQILLKE